MFRKLAFTGAHLTGRALGWILDTTLGPVDSPTYVSRTAPATPPPIAASPVCLAPLLLGQDGTLGIFACGECSACRA